MVTMFGRARSNEERRAEEGGMGDLAAAACRLARRPRDGDELTFARRCAMCGAAAGCACVMVCGRIVGSWHLLGFMRAAEGVCDGEGRRQVRQVLLGCSLSSPCSLLVAHRPAGAGA